MILPTKSFGPQGEDLTGGSQRVRLSLWEVGGHLKPRNDEQREAGSEKERHSDSFHLTPY